MKKVILGVLVGILVLFIALSTVIRKEDAEKRVKEVEKVIRESDREENPRGKVIVDYSKCNWNSGMSVILQGRDVDGKFYCKKFYKQVDFENIPYGNFELYVMDKDTEKYMQEILIDEDNREITVYLDF